MLALGGVDKFGMDSFLRFLPENSLSRNDNIAAFGHSRHASGMLKRVFALAVASVLLLPSLLFNAVAFGGQWRCGLMGAQVIIGDTIAAIGIVIGIRLWPFSSDAASKRKTLTVATLAILLGCVAYILFLSPECPFAAR